MLQDAEKSSLMALLLHPCSRSFLKALLVLPFNLVATEFHSQYCSQVRANSVLLQDAVKSSLMALLLHPCSRSFHKTPLALPFNLASTGFQSQYCSQARTNSALPQNAVKSSLMTRLLHPCSRSFHKALLVLTYRIGRLICLYWLFVRMFQRIQLAASFVKGIGHLLHTGFCNFCVTVHIDQFHCNSFLFRCKITHFLSDLH